MEELVFTPTDFVAALNQTLEYTYPSILIQGELANFRVSKNRWVYFDLKDEFSSVKFFGTVYQLPGPLQDGLMLQVRGNPRLHPQYGFSVNIVSIQPVGEGSIKKAAALLEAKLTAEGLFDPARKRLLPYPPRSVGLITSRESAAYHDFIKILNSRWGGVEISLMDVQVQGEIAPGQIIAAIEHFNSHADPPEVLVVTRGGGSAEDLAAFSTEQVTRSVASSRIPTLVAIGHEVDISLAELAADQRASTPSNAAELLVPDKKQIKAGLVSIKQQLNQLLSARIVTVQHDIDNKSKHLEQEIKQLLKYENQKLLTKTQLLRALNPEAPLSRGYALVRAEQKVIKSAKDLRLKQTISLSFYDSSAKASITSIEQKSKR